LKQEMQPLFGTDTAATLNSEFLRRNSASLPHIVAGNNLCFIMYQSEKLIYGLLVVAFSALTLLVWQQEGHLACKNE